MDCSKTKGWHRFLPSAIRSKDTCRAVGMEASPEISNLKPQISNLACFHRAPIAKWPPHKTSPRWVILAVLAENQLSRVFFGHFLQPSGGLVSPTVWLHSRKTWEKRWENIGLRSFQCDIYSNWKGGKNPALIRHSLPEPHFSAHHFSAHHLSVPCLSVVCAHCSPDSYSSGPSQVIPNNCHYT